MKFSGWSSLLLAALLSTTAVELVRAEDAGNPVMVDAFLRRTVAAAPADVEDTGSIAPATAPRRATLRSLAAPADDTLTALSPKTEDAPSPQIARADHDAIARIDAAASALPVPDPVDAGAPNLDATPPAPQPAATAAAPAEPAVSTPADPTSAIDAVAATIPLPEPIGAEPPAAASAATPLPETGATAAVETNAPTPEPTATGTAPTPPLAETAAPQPAATPSAAAAAAPAPSPASAATPSPEAIAASLEAQRVAEAMEKAAVVEAGRAGPSVDRAERAALVEFYRARDWRPFFVDAKDLSREGRALAGVLADAARDGLDPADYALPTTRLETPEARAAAEYMVGETALRYARQLASGRFDPSRLSDLVTPRPPRPDPAAVLKGFAEGGDLAAALAHWAPPHEGYRRLKAELARLRDEAETPVVRLPDGPLLAPGQKDGRVALLRERLGVLAVATDADPETYDPALAEAVKAFQRQRGISPSGKVGRSTVAALNEEARGAADRIADVTVNMERWRWLPRDLGELHVFVNIPDFHLDVVKNGRSIHHARVITGRPENQTPIFSETMEYVVVNPYWNVPYSIVKKEMMAKLQEGRLGGSFEVEVGDQRVDPATVDWTQVSPGRVSIRQRPGDGNALGNIKFMFPNQHSVYIHDTSSRSLFARDYRALSHGCVRVHEPFSFADAVLSEEPDGLNGARLKKQIGGSERQINLQRHIPVHIGYFTEFVDDDGHLQSRRDVYGHDAKMRRILGL
ncbi:MAG: L,D-transpeptidase family protein [Hyphomicrobiales bacterium]|nr:L,D-transpeptidase family protein [Hyphomicrobiales bacterium]